MLSAETAALLSARAAALLSARAAALLSARAAALLSAGAARAIAAAAAASAHGRGVQGKCDNLTQCISGTHMAGDRRAAAISPKASQRRYHYSALQKHIGGMCNQHMGAAIGKIYAQCMCTGGISSQHTLKQWRHCKAAVCRLMHA